ELLDLAMIGTIGDMVKVTGEGHIIVKRGLEMLNQTDRPGLRALIKNAGLTLGSINETDRKSTRLNSSHVSISYAVFCLKKNGAQLNRTRDAVQSGPAAAADARRRRAAARRPARMPRHRAGRARAEVRRPRRDAPGQSGA